MIRGGGHVVYFYKLHTFTTIYLVHGLRMSIMYPYRSSSARVLAPAPRLIPSPQRI